MADFGVRLIAAEGGIDLDEDKFGDAQAEGAADFSGDELSDEGEDALAGSAKLNDVEAEVVGFDDRGQRTTLPRSARPGQCGTWAGSGYRLQGAGSGGGAGDGLQVTERRERSALASRLVVD
jgi:hypothetical protein